MKRIFNSIDMRGLSLVLCASVVVILASCKASGDYPGMEYAPNMYHSVAYEPLSQIVDLDEGT
ncbi:MAG: hypothetical protein ACKOE6_11615, partial [Flammeovirgaceae bacterium]